MALFPNSRLAPKELRSDIVSVTGVQPGAGVQPMSSP